MKTIAGLATVVLAFGVIGTTQTASAGSGWVNLPRSGTGFKTHEPAYRQWGQARLVNGLMNMGRGWTTYAHRGRTLNYGDMSKYGGGYFPPHQTHRDGRDCDMSMINWAGDAQPGLTRFMGGYSHNNTGQLVWYMYHMSGNSIRVIYFNDTSLGTTYCTGHDNHLHYGIW